MLEVVFLEGPAFFRGTFHAGGRFPGRSLGPASNLAITAVTGPSRNRAWRPATDLESGSDSG